MNLDILENQRLAEQAECDGTKQQSERNRLGQFATPTRLATEMLKYGVGLLGNKSPIRFLDPALGTGSFFSALLRTIKSGRPVNAVGFEIDPLYVDVSIRRWERLTRVLVRHAETGLTFEEMQVARASSAGGHSADSPDKED